MYFGSVRFFKHVIVLVTVILIIVPTVFCFVLGSQLSDAQKQITDLKAEVSSYKSTGHQLRYTDNELFALYRDNLANKEAFLKLLYEYDNDAYKKAAGIRDDVVPTSNETVLTEPHVTEPAGTTAPAETEDTFVTTAGEIHAAYESLYPDLYADVPENIVYNQDIDCVYLTFDDGPSKHTSSILYYLKAYDIKATFFVVPDGSEESNARLKAIADAGHTIGIHTATHEYNKIYASVEAYLEDFKIAYDRVYEATGIKCNLFRFPGGSINDYNGDIRDELIAEMTRRGFIYFDWNVDSSDALGATWTEMYNNVLNQTRDVQRAVILMHDYNGGANTVLVLEDIIKALISSPRGYKLTSLTEFVKPVQF